MMADRPTLVGPAQTIVGPTPGLCFCRIVAVNNSDPLTGYPLTANLSAAFTYDADVQMPNGAWVPCRKETNTNIRPDNESRWRSPWVVEAFAVGSMLPAVVQDGVLRIAVREERWAAPCGWTPTIPPPPTPTPTGPPPIFTIPTPGDIPPPSGYIPSPGIHPTVPPPPLVDPNPPRLTIPVPPIGPGAAIDPPYPGANP